MGNNQGGSYCILKERARISTCGREPIGTESMGTRRQSCILSGYTLEQNGYLTGGDHCTTEEPCLGSLSGVSDWSG